MIDNLELGKHLLDKKDVFDCVKEFVVTDFDDSVFLSIWKGLNKFFEHFIFYEKDIFYIRKIDLVAVSKRDMQNIIKTDFKEFYVEIKKDSETKKVLGVDTEIMFTKIKFNKFDILRLEGTIFGDELMLVDNVSRTITIRKKNFFPNMKFERLLDKKIKKEIIEDYKKHFWLIDDFLDFVMACRFTGNRKRSYLYLNAPSDWGKSFLCGVFDNLNLMSKVEYKHFVAERPVGLSVQKIFRSLVLFLDEFTVFKKEMKGTTHKMSIEEKFKTEIEVEVYAKILMSAEYSNSFIDTVEKQIINRVLVMNVESNIQLTDREVYKKYGNYAYMSAVTEYVLEEIMKRYNKYYRLGIIEADKLAEKTLNALFEKYKIDEIDLESYLINFIAEKIEDLVEIKKASMIDSTNVLSYEEQQLIKYIYIKNENIYINKFAQFVDKLFELELSADKKKSASYKKTILPKLLFDVKTYTDIEKVIRFDKISKRVIQIDLSKLYFKYAIRTKKIKIDDNVISFANFDDLITKINELIRDYRETNKTTKAIKENIIRYGFGDNIRYIEEGSGELIGVEAIHSQKIPF